MAPTFTPNLHLELQGTGDNSGTWGAELNTAVFTILDTVLGGVQTLSLGSSNVTVTTPQSQNNAVILTGALTNDVAVIFPSIGRTYYIANNTTGAHSVTIKTASAGVTTTIPQGGSGFYVLNVTDVLVPSLPGVPIGAIQQFAMTTLPAGWLECDGSAISRVTYAALFGTIGTTFGTGNGSTTFNIPDMRGYFARGWDHGAGVDPARVFGSTQTSANLAHTHTGTTGTESATHTHSYTAQGRYGLNQQSTSVFRPAVGDSAGSTPTLITDTESATHTHSFTTGSSGGSESRPINLALLFAIKVI